MKTRNEAAMDEIDKLFQRTASVIFNMKWFFFGMGQLGVLASSTSEDHARAMLANMRNDTEDFREAANEAADQMDHLLNNIEESLNARKEKQNA